jgi:hypothetical protein
VPLTLHSQNIPALSGDAAKLKITPLILCAIHR